MENTRLSKLQRWILIRCFERNSSELPVLLTKEVFFHYYEGRNNKLEASVSRSLRNLYHKNLIIPLTARRIVNPLSQSMFEGKQDIASTLALQYGMTGKSMDECKSRLQELIKQHGRTEKLLSPAVVEAGENILALQLTELGKKEALMLSREESTKLNNNNHE